MIIQVVRFAMIKDVYSTELEVEQFQTDHKPDGTNEGTVWYIFPVYMVDRHSFSTRSVESDKLYFIGKK